MTRFRTLALAAALIGSVAAPAFAQERFVPGAVSVPGPVASPAAPVTASRTALAAPTMDAPVVFLERSGATGGNGQHS